MVEPEKPFACSIPDCGMTFTNEDHLTVHTKKHDMYLQLGLEQKAAFVADQTPTPTRFIRNCEEVGLFQDLQNVNPFEEGFKRAMETCKHGLLSLENSAPTSTSDDLHTPQMVFPLDPGDATSYTSNNQKNITISRSSSDESGTIKEYETTTISKLTNQVTTISRVVNKHDVIDKHTDDTQKTDEHIRQRDVHNETSVSYTNNVIKIHNNIEIRKDNLINVEMTKIPPANKITYENIAKEATTKDVLLTDISKVDKLPLPPIMSQKSLDFVVDSLTSDICLNSKPEVKIKNPINQLPKIKSMINVIVDKPAKTINNKQPLDNCSQTEIPTSNTQNDTENYEVIIKLPNGKQVRMKAVEDEEKNKQEINAKEKLKLAINNKVTQNNLQRLTSVAPIQGIPIAAGTLIPITIINPTALTHKIPIPPLSVPKPSQQFKKTVKRKVVTNTEKSNVSEKTDAPVDVEPLSVDDDDASAKKRKEDLNSRVAASRRYRVRLRETMKKQINEIKQLKEANQRLTAEKALLKILITEHMRSCPNADDLRTAQERLLQSNVNLTI